ncbi:hypothetical protein D3C86_1956460 [compost metagenome]
MISFGETGIKIGIVRAEILGKQLVIIGEPGLYMLKVFTKRCIDAVNRLLRLAL